MKQFFIVLVLFSLVHFPLNSPAVQTETSLPESISPERVQGLPLVEPADVYRKLLQLQYLYDQLGDFLAVNKVKPLGLVVKKVAPHDLYFAALTLFSKNNRLLYETTSDQLETPANLGGTRQPADVLAMLEQAEKALTLVAVSYGLQLDNLILGNEVHGDQAEMYAIMFRLSRYANSFLEQPFSPSDAYEEVTVGISYGSNLLRAWGALRRIPPRQAFIAGKQSHDVYVLLGKCLHIVSVLYRQKGLEPFEIDFSGIDHEKIGPGDVYDLAALLVARLDYFSDAVGMTRQPRNIFYPGRKFPPHVYQQTHILYDQLTLLRQETGIVEGD